MKLPGNHVNRFICGLLAVAMLLSAGVLPVYAEPVWADMHARYKQVPQLEYEGVRYRLKSRLTTILLAGIDHTSDTVSAPLEHRNGGQADFMLLLVMDDAAKTITPIQIDRDTMTEITVLNVLGEVSGTRTAQICLSHSFGDGAEYSCELMKDAVSKLLMGTPVNHYFTMNMDGIAAFNDAIGGVEVTLEDDFSVYDPEMTQGKTLVLQGEQAEYYLRQRYYVGDQSNASRLERQKNYINRAQTALVKKRDESQAFVNRLFDVLEPYIVTDISRGRLINMVNSAGRYSILPVSEIAGKRVIGEGGFVEFYADEEALTELTLSIFYNVKNENGGE